MNGFLEFIFGPFIALVCIGLFILNRPRKLEDLQRERSYLKRVDKNTWPS